MITERGNFPLVVDLFPILGVTSVSMFSVKLRVMWQKVFVWKVLKPGLTCNNEVRQFLFILNQEEEVAADLVK